VVCRVEILQVIVVAASVSTGRGTSIAVEWSSLLVSVVVCC